eukprot:SAG31_NODE_21015_length_559_cov_1.800000_1_plen_103_part_10
MPARARWVLLRGTITIDNYLAIIIPESSGGQPQARRMLFDMVRGSGWLRRSAVPMADTIKGRADRGPRDFKILTAIDMCAAAAARGVLRCCARFVHAIHGGWH